MENNLSEKAQKFLAKNPTLIGVVCGYRFFECPVHGDETDLKVITHDGKVKSSGYYDLPTKHELIGITL